MVETGMTNPRVARHAVPQRARVLATCCGAHILHDGFSALIYVLLPVWQAALGLSLAEVGVLRTAFTGATAILQMPSSLVADRIGERWTLVMGTALAGIGYILAGWAGGFATLLLCLAVGGAGSSVQHPISASLTARAFEGRSLRTALSTYNFSGDIGKMLLPALTTWLVTLWHWRVATMAVGLLGLATALAILFLLPASSRRTIAETSPRPVVDPPVTLDSALARRGFWALSAVATVDSATRTGFLTFLPFLLTLKGASLPTIGVALSLVFAGGATGKFVCGIVARRAGILRTVILTECATAAGIVLLLPLSIMGSLILLPLIGVVLNGTSSVLYGTVAELAPAERRARAFGVFYTVTIAAGAIAPALYGVFSDAHGVKASLVLVAAVVLLVVPLTLPLRAPLAALPSE